MDAPTSLIEVPTDLPVEPPMAPAALEALTRSEIDVQITTAKKYPRHLRRALGQAEELATVDVETAASCFYVLKRQGKRIEGPSIRLAEIVASAWGNLRWGARPVADDGRMVTAAGYCHDLETNVARLAEVKRRVTGRDGKRYSDDMIAVTSNAACAIAARNALFGVVPRAYVDAILRKAKTVAVGDAKTLGQRRQDLVAYFRDKVGVEETMLLAYVGRETVEEISLDDLGDLHGLATALRDGTTTVDEAFGGEKDAGTGYRQPRRKSEAVTDQAASATAPTAVTETAAEATEQAPADDEPITENHAKMLESARKNAKVSDKAWLAAIKGISGADCLENVPLAKLVPLSDWIAAQRKAGA